MTTAETLAALDADPRVRLSATGNWLDAEPTTDDTRTKRWV